MDGEECNSRGCRMCFMCWMGGNGTWYIYIQFGELLLMWIGPLKNKFPGHTSPLDKSVQVMSATRGGYSLKRQVDVQGGIKVLLQLKFSEMRESNIWRNTMRNQNILQK